MIEQKQVFDEIAPGWYNFRHWTIFRAELEAMAKRWQTGKLVNLGCGHGADFLPFKDNFELYGVDFSAGMLLLAQKYAMKFDFEVNLTEADVAHLPYQDECFDWAISVATYHHLQSRQERLDAFLELKRVLKPGGEAFITVWNRWQPRFWFKGREVLVPWRTQGKTLQRYYYLFTYAELEAMAQQAGLTVLRSAPESSHRFPMKTFSQNICLLVKREAQ